jgi:uncharacterized protein DUF1360
MLDWSPWFRLTLSVLATWRVSHLIAHEDGPFDAIVRLRARAGNGMLGRLMDCPYCLSLWLAAPLALLLARTPGGWCVAWLAISGGASLLERLSRSTPAPRPAAAESMILPLDGAHDDVMLRTETRDDDDATSPGDPVTSQTFEPRP